MSTNTPALDLPLELVQEVRNNMEIGQMQPMLIGTKAENVQVPRQATSLGLVVREEDSTIASVAASPDIDLMVGQIPGVNRKSLNRSWLGITSCSS